MSSGRSYAGEAPEDRSARRRRQLLDAGLELFGTIGYRKTTVRALCREARVADRNFYEEFASTEDLLLAVYHECLDRLQAAAVQAIGAPGAPDGDVAGFARRGLDGFFACVEDDHRLARVVWFEVLGVSARIEAAYLERMNDFGELLIALLAEGGFESGVSPDDRRVMFAAAVGGISHLAVTWVTAGFQPPRSELVRPLSAFLLAGADASRARLGEDA